MKRFFIFILTAVLLLSLSSCFMLPDVETMEWAVLTVPEGGANKGDLVIANTSNAAVIPAPEEQASIAEMQSQHTPAIYQNSGLSTHMDKDALTALGHMLTDFNHAQKVNDVQIQYAYVSADSLGTLPADHLTGLAVRFAGDGTGIDNVNAAFFGKLADREAVFFKRLRDGCALILIDLAAKGHNPDFSGDIVFYF